MSMSACLYGLAMALVVGAPVQVLRVPTGDAQAPVRSQVLAGSKQARIRALIGDAVSASLPAGWRVEDVTLVGQPSAFAGRTPHEGLVGAARIEANLTGPVRRGAQPLSVIVSDDRGPFERRRAQVTLQRAAHTQGVKRGNEVTVYVRSGNVFVQARCVAQSSAEVGEAVTVLCDNATRTLGANVLSQKEVEVTL